MVKANRLMPKTGTAAAPVSPPPPAQQPVSPPPVVQTTPVKPEDALQRASSLSLSLPEDLFGSSITSLPVQEVQATVPFIGFASNRSPSWASQQSAGLNDGDLYLQSSNGMTPLQELKFWMIDAFYCFTRVNDNNEILEAKSQLTEVEVKADTFQEHYICPIIVEDNGEFIPAKLEVRGARAAAAKQVMNAIQTAASPEWSKSSDAARIASAFPAPWGRQTAWLRGARRQARSTGRFYVQTTAAVRPTTLTDMEQIAKASMDTAFTATLAEVRSAINERIEEMNNKAA